MLKIILNNKKLVFNYLILGLVSLFLFGELNGAQGLFKDPRLRFLTRFVLSFLFFLNGYLNIKNKFLKNLFLIINCGAEVLLIFIAALRYFLCDSTFLVELYAAILRFTISPIDLGVVYLIYRRIKFFETA